MKIKANSKGQIALIVLVISAVVMTIGLSVAKKSVVETKITTDEELLKQAFNAAESGIDYYLGTGVTSFTASDNKSKADVNVASIGGDSGVINFDGLTLKNNEAYAWLVGHKADGAIDMNVRFLGTGITLCVDSGFNGSLKVDYFYNETANYKVTRLGFNVGTPVNPVSNYIVPTEVVCPGLTGKIGISLSLPISSGIPLLLAVKPIGNNTHIIFYGDGNFPSQGEEIRSSGTAGDVTGDSNATVSRNIRVINQYFVPAFMLDAITAYGKVSTN